MYRHYTGECMTIFHFREVEGMRWKILEWFLLIVLFPLVVLGVILNIVFSAVAVGWSISDEKLSMHWRRKV